MKFNVYNISVILVIILTTGAAFKNSTISIPGDGWYQVRCDQPEPNISGSNPAVDQQAPYSRTVFDMVPVAFSSITCDNLSSKLCAVYFQASTEDNIPSPVESLYFIAGGCP